MIVRWLFDDRSKVVRFYSNKLLTIFEQLMNKFPIIIGTIADSAMFYFYGFLERLISITGTVFFRAKTSGVICFMDEQSIYII